MIKERDKLKKENEKLQKEAELNKSTVKKNEEMINKMLFDKNKLQDEIETVKIKMENQMDQKEQQYRHEVERLNDLQDKENDEGIIKFRLYFESLKTDINNLLGAIEDIKDKDAAENYKNALSKTLDVIKGRL